MKTRTTRLKNSDSSGYGSQKGTPTKRTRLHGRFLLASLAALGGVVVFNALALQKERHPSPMFQPVMAAAPLPAILPSASPQPALVRKEQMAAAQMVPPSSALPMAPSIPPAGERTALAERISATEKPRLAPPPTPPADAADAALLLDLQRELSKRGHYKGELDGKSGPMMVQAIRSFQFSQRVSIDGKPSETLLREVRATKVPPMKDELLDLLRKTTPDNKTNPDKSGRALMGGARAPDRAG